MSSPILDRLGEPSAKGLAMAVSQAISDGELSPGEQLPTVRGLARELGVSPTTVAAAWQLLTSAGTIRTDGRRGTLVADRRAPTATRYRRALERSDVGNGLDLATGIPDPALLPDLREALDRLPRTAAPSSYLDEPVLPDLLAVLRDSWPIDSDALTVVDGAMDALDLLSGLLVRFGDRVAVDDPCFPPLLDLLENAGAKVLGIAQDDDGPLPESLQVAVRAGARVCFIQPRAQNPTGASLTEARARQLVDILRPHDVTVVENDSAGAVAATGLVSLGRWLPDRVVHIRSFSKSHGPDLRLAAVSGPGPLIASFEARRRLGQGWSSRLLQQLLLHLLTSATTAEQVQRAAQEYARRRQLLVSELSARGVTVPGRDGINIWLPVGNETSALLRLASRGIQVSAGSPFMRDESSSPRLRVTVGLLAAGHDVVATELAAAAAETGWRAPR